MDGHNLHTPANAHSESDGWHRMTHELWESGQRRLAFRRFLAAAQRGDSDSRTMLGYFCDWGEFQNALTWFERALALGDKSALCEIARMYFRHRKNVRQTILHAQQITEAKPGIGVTQWEFDSATRLLRWLKRREIAA
jgi:TPR repeat protein